MAGSTVRRELATCTSTSARCYQACHPALALSGWAAARRCLINRHPCRDSHHTITQARQLALRRRLRLPLRLRLHRCGPSPGCGGLVNVFGLLARRAKIVERALVRVAREAVGADGQVVPQQWLSNTTAPGVAPDDRRCLDLVICYGASPMGGALCCDATLVSPPTRKGQPQPGMHDGAMLRGAGSEPLTPSSAPASRARLRDRWALE